MYQIWRQSFDSFPRHLNWFGGLGGPLNPQNAPWGSMGRFVAYAHSQMNPQTWTEVGANRSSRLTASTDFWICDPLNPPPPQMPPGILRGELYLIYVHSQTNPQTCTKVGANQSSWLTASPDIWMCDWPPPPKTPWGIEGRIVVSPCPFPDESADLYQIWCQSVQPFDSFPKNLNLWHHKKPEMPLRYCGTNC